MGALDPIAFDIETSGLEPGSVITVAGLATDMGEWLGLNTTGRDANASRLETAVEHESDSNVRVSVHPDESSLLTALGEFAHQRIDGDRNYLTAYHGETYERRWGIETSYRVVGYFLPKTASTDVSLRVFYYRMAVLLYNMWVLVNAVVSESIGHPSDASPPVTGKYLLVILRNKHDEQGTT